MTDELKPCAHCGGGHVVEEWRREDDRTDYWTMTLWRVTCGECGMSTDWHASREAALDVWNKRADEFGADDDYERRMDELLCRLTNGKWSKSRSYSVDFMVSCVDEAYDERVNDELTAERDELRDIIDHMPKTEQECEACQEAHDRLMFNAKVDMDKLRDELKHKQLVIDRQRNSFLKMEAENAELRRMLADVAEAF